MVHELIRLPMLVASVSALITTSIPAAALGYWCTTDRDGATRRATTGHDERLF